MPGAMAPRASAPAARYESAATKPSAFEAQAARAKWLMLAPLLVVLLLVAGWPLIRTISESFTDAYLSSPDSKFVGLDNYVALMQDPRWRRAVLNTLAFALISVALETILGVAIALVLNANMPGRGLTRAAMLIPWAIPTVVSAKMWAWMLNDLNGVVNMMLMKIGLIAQPIAWLADPWLAMASVIAVDVWKATPFMALLALAALQTIPDEVYESAKLDGAGAWTIFTRITLPLIAAALTIAVIFRALDALRIFDVIYVLTGTTRATSTMSIYARQQLVEFQDVGFGSAAATCVFLIIAIIVAIVVTVRRVDVEPLRSAS
ncbi:carbohydrate ABC transporter permease [Terrirubrum flagellatum]|uniref:carbohydrate ABC transporter permease n=1 Tax=Terrirubrum flagellatum TaxID=2895980 RepID=UPI003CC814EA